MAKRNKYEDLGILDQGGDAQIDGFMEGAPAKEVRTSQQAARVVSVPLSQVIPDKFQARVILPPELKQPFFTGERDCYDTARALLAAAESDPGLRRQVGELLGLGNSIQSEGQIEPATGAWIKTSAGPKFLLEAGERRFWSLVLTTVQLGLKDELRLNIVESKEVSRFRQVAENFQREDLSAVDMGKAVASIILLSMDMLPSPEMDELDYYRQAALIKRIPSGTWPMVERVAGFSESYLARHLKLLTLENELLYLASLYRLNESLLRKIIAAPKQQQKNLMVMAIEQELVATDIPEAVLETSDVKASIRTAPGAHRQLASRVKSLVKFVNQPAFDHDYDRVASELSALYRNPDDLLVAADDLESLASSLRKIRDRRH